MADSNLPPILIKKIKKVEGGHHGGAWKVAYADFVTAMMAFFLMLWLLSSTTEEQKMGLADYFTPAAVSNSQGGSNGVMGGQSMVRDGAKISDNIPIGVTVPLPGDPQVNRDDGEEEYSGTSELEPPTNMEEQLDAAVEKAIQQREEQQFQDVERALAEAMEQTPELREIEDSLLIDRVPEGLRIQLVDQEGRPLFASGSAVLTPVAQQLHELVGRTIGGLPNNLSIRGHTDATPFRGDGSYSNWDLSADRANASRRTLLAYGVKAERVTEVVGRAEREPLLEDDPQNPQNRRISIILMKDAVSPSALAPERIAEQQAAEAREAQRLRTLERARTGDASLPPPELRNNGPARAVAPFISDGL